MLWRWERRRFLVEQHTAIRTRAVHGRHARAGPDRHCIALSRSNRRCMVIFETCFSNDDTSLSALPPSAAQRESRGRSRPLRARCSGAGRASSLEQPRPGPCARAFTCVTNWARQVEGRQPRARAMRGMFGAAGAEPLKNNLIESITWMWFGLRYPLFGTGKNKGRGLAAWPFVFELMACCLPVPPLRVQGLACRQAWRGCRTSGAVVATRIGTWALRSTPRSFGVLIAWLAAFSSEGQ